ncbi:hypothetical protein [Desulfosediminicola sp.]|uniref:hypothetical protein n=1 Tax=Desulfosediminicola sp. TaxID=2886825 RepID=UPI003AF2C0D0
MQDVISYTPEHISYIKTVLVRNEQTIQLFMKFVAQIGEENPLCSSHDEIATCIRILEQEGINGTL